MYRGFNLKLSVPRNDINKFYPIGNQLYDRHKTLTEKALMDLMFSDNSLDGSKIQTAWFPQIKADIFISHSHNDKEEAITLAGWLWKTFKLTSFVDSCIWGYSDNLLRAIDDKLCWQPHSSTYNYSKRNFSTSHVHMMLSSALSMMIDRTECLFFLNTPSSVKPYDGIQKTESPWIYSEIVTTQLVRENIPERLKILTESWLGDNAQQDLIKGRNFSITHNIDLGHLSLIDIDSLNTWREKHLLGNALDKLYELNPAIIKSKK